MPEESTTRDAGYGAAAKTMHWLIAALLAGQFALAWTMPEVHRGTQPETLIGLHLSIGAVLLLAVVVRLLWRIARPVPLVRDGVPLWQFRAAQTTHALLYLLLLVLPLMGWANAFYRGWTIDLFGLTRLPHLLPQGSPLGRALGDIHILSAYALLALVGLHVAAALYHHYGRNDGMLARMLP